MLDIGLEVTILPADNKHPDCIFVEDQAIVIDGHVLLPVPGHPSRVAEQPPIADFLSRQLNGFQVCGMFGDARMDGGDILRLGDIFFVGRSERTNEAGIETLRNLLTHLGHELRIVDIPTEKALHLTSISSTPTDNIILTAEGYLTPEDFGELPEGCEVILMPEEEVYGCNTIGFKNGKSSLQKVIQPFSKRSRRKVWIQSFSTWARFVRRMVRLRAVPSSSNLKQRVDIRECGRSVCCRGRPAWSKALG